MGKKKPFIDKKHAQRYTLVFRSTDDTPDEEVQEAGDGVLVPADSSSAGAAAAVGRQQEPPTKDPRALYAHFFGGDNDDEERVSCHGRVWAAACASLADCSCRICQLVDNRQDHTHDICCN